MALPPQASSADSASCSELQFALPAPTIPDDLPVRSRAWTVRYCLMTQTWISGWTSACSRTGTRYTPSALIGSWSST